MPERGFRSDDVEVVVSAALKETAINTAQTLDTKLRLDAGALPDIEPDIETNSGELKGAREVTQLYKKKDDLKFTMPFKRATPDAIGFMTAYAYGECTTTASGTGFKNTMSFISGEEMTTFTMAVRYAGVMKRLYHSNSVSKYSISAEIGGYINATADIVATGKYTNNYVEEAVTAAYNATSLTLDANAVEGATAADRLLSIHNVRVLVPTTAEWKQVVCTAASAATPSILTIVAPGGVVTSTTYKVLYRNDESGADWRTFPNYFATEDAADALRCTSIAFKIGGKWDGDSYEGGYALNCRVTKLNFELDNKAEVDACMTGTNVLYGNRISRGSEMMHKMTASLEFESVLEKSKFENMEEFAVSVEATGNEYATGENCKVVWIFPKCAYLKNKLGSDKKKLKQDVEIQVMQHDTYGSVIHYVINTRNGYAQ